MAVHNDIGKWGEEQAVLYLRQKGWYIRHRDWHDGHRDLDIVAIDEDSSILLFVEVKTRTSEQWGQPDEAIDLQKRNNIIHAAAAYVRCFRMNYCELRYDTISVIGTPESGANIIHKENAFDVTSSFEYHEQKRWKRKRRDGRW